MEIYEKYLEGGAQTPFNHPPVCTCQHAFYDREKEQSNAYIYGQRVRRRFQFLIAALSRHCEPDFIVPRCLREPREGCDEISRAPQTCPRTHSHTEVMCPE